MTFTMLAAWLLVSIIGGGTAAIAGFGIGSILTPVLGARYSIADSYSFHLPAAAMCFPLLS